ncbi:hypothetical protein JTB14_014589 [Gonioctena quinquepunctata]|nr:hypothetical protein JTB14_014589 [Gonioctena quinquepunctata]
MKDDGFLDELENLITDDNDCDIYSPDESTFLSIMSYRSDEEKYRNSEPIFRYSDDSERTLIHENSKVGEQDNDDYEGTDFKNNDGYFERGEQSGGILDGEVFKPCGTSRRSAGGNIDKLKFPENKRNIVESQGIFMKVDTVTCNSSGFDNEFTESLGDDLENGLNIVEAYNDDGRELIEVQVVVDRRVVNFETLQNLQEDLQQSEMVFYQNADQTYECHYPADEHIYDSIPGSSVDDRKYDVPTNKNITGDNYREKHSPVEDNSVVQNMYYSPANINAVMNVAEEPFYETVGYLNPDEKNAQNFYVYAPDSNRSTIYSTTSRDSSVFDEDDEGIELGRPNHEDIYPNVRRETFCDAMGVVRIERVAFPEQLGLGSTSSSESSVSSPVSRSNSTTSARKLEYIIEEIKTTERKYVEDLAKVVQDFRPFVEKHTPESMKARQGYLFGNIEKMYKRQLKFLASVEESGDEVNNIVRCFIDHDRLFEMYPNYFRNKPKADTVLKEFSPIIKFMQERFEERLDFSAYLLTPVQRLGKYILFLENIEKELKKLNMPIGSTQMALDIVKSEMSKGNDYVAIDSIQNSPISKLDYGSFKMREHFSITKPRRVEAMVFLFENVVVLTTSDPNNHEIFNYYDSIKMNDLRIATFENFTIHLTDYTKSKKKHNSTKYTYVMEAKTEKIWNSWRETIESILWQQLYKAKELTLTAQNTKYRFIKNKGRVKSTGSSVFYVE